MSDKHLPIGVFDSGVGGLTVVRALMEQMPNEQILYVGDTARVPWGPKSPETVQRYALEIGTWLEEQGAKIVVVACNTATSVALPLLQERLSIPVLGVIEPTVKAVANVASNAVVGVIGTAATIRSKAYEVAMKKIAPQVRLIPQACPLFVPMVEEGWLSHAATYSIAREYLSPLKEAGVSVLVLGCTHYPLLVPVIQEIMGDDVLLVDSAAETSLYAKKMLIEKQIVSDTEQAADHRFVVSDAPQQFLNSVRSFLGREIDGVEYLSFG